MIVYEDERVDNVSIQVGRCSLFAVSRDLLTKEIAGAVDSTWKAYLGAFESLSHRNDMRLSIQWHFRALVKFRYQLAGSKIAQECSVSLPKAAIMPSFALWFYCGLEGKGRWSTRFCHTAVFQYPKAHQCMLD